MPHSRTAVSAADPFQEADRERPLVSRDRPVRSGEPVSASGAGGPGETGQVVDGGDESGQPFVVLGAGLPSVGCVIRRGNQLVRCPGLEEAPARSEDAEMGPEELVRGADEEVGADPVQVEEAVLGEMHAVHRDESTHVLRARHQFPRRRDRADGIGCEGERDEPGPWGQGGGEGVHVDGDVFLANVHPSDGGAGVGCRHHPRADVRVVIQPSHDDLVAGLERFRERPGHVEEESRRIRAEDDLVRLGPREIGGRAACLRHQPVRLLARDERTVCVAQARVITPRHGLDHRVGDLGASGGVGEDQGPAVFSQTGECREPRADAANVEHGNRLPGGARMLSSGLGAVHRGHVGPAHPRSRPSVAESAATSGSLPGRASRNALTSCSGSVRSR